MIRYCSALLICASLAGCMTVPVDVETGPRAPASAFLDPSLLQSAPDKGEIRIARDAGVSGAAVNVLIYLDGRHVVNVDANRVAVLRVPAGMRKIESSTSTCPNPSSITSCGSNQASTMTIASAALRACSWASGASSV